MAGVPQNFATLSNVLPTYDFVDIVAGTGIINFYAGNTVDLKLLSNNEFYSDAVSSDSASFNNTDYTKLLDLDFDVLLNRPLVLKGKTVVNVPIMLYSDVNPSAYVTVKVRKWTGSTETDLASNDSSVSTFVGAATNYYMKAIDIDVPLTVFKIGEYLRLTIEGWAKLSSGMGTGTLKIGNDPMNRSTGWDTTGAVPSKLVFQCPVRLNL